MRNIFSNQITFDIFYLERSTIWKVPSGTRGYNYCKLLYKIWAPTTRDVLTRRAF